MWRPTDKQLARLMVSVVMVGVLLVTLVAAGVSAASAASPSPMPSPSPSPTAVAPPASPSPGSPRQEQVEYRTYVSTVTIDGAGLMAALLQLRSCHENREACRRSLEQASGQVTGFEGDLDRTPAPACLAGVDAQLRSALGFYDTGLGLVKTGGDAKDQLKVIQGGILIGVGTWKFGVAIREARHANS